MLLSKFVKHRRVGQVFAQNLSRSFAAASNHDGFRDMAQTEQPVVDYEVPDVAANQSIKSAPAAKASLPVLPHFDYTPPKYAGPSYEQIKAMRVDKVSPASFTFYREPLLIVDGKM